MIVLTGKVTRVIWPKTPAAGFHVLKLSVSGISGTAKAVGEVSWTPKVDESLELEGDWGTDKTGDKQFEFKSVTPWVPEDPRAMLTYACDLAKGVGPAMETLIWEAWGADWMSLADAGTVKGLRGEKYKSFRDVISRLTLEAERAKIVSSLISHGCTTRVAAEAWERWNTAAMNVVSGNPFTLTEISGVGFVWVDEHVRTSFDIPPDDPRRIDAAVYYFATRAVDSNTVFSVSSMIAEAAAVLGQNYQTLIQVAFNQALESGALRQFPDVPGIAALASHATAEAKIWEYANT